MASGLSLVGASRLSCPQGLWDPRAPIRYWTCVLCIGCLTTGPPGKSPFWCFDSWSFTDPGGSAPPRGDSTLWDSKQLTSSSALTNANQPRQSLYPHHLVYQTPKLEPLSPRSKHCRIRNQTLGAPLTPEPAEVSPSLLPLPHMFLLREATVKAHSHVPSSFLSPDQPWYLPLWHECPSSWER